jgi:hypothetical protein
MYGCTGFVTRLVKNEPAKAGTCKVFVGVFVTVLMTRTIGGELLSIVMYTRVPA